MILRVLAAGLAVVSTWAASAVAAPLEAYGKLPALERAAISPDGLNFAVAATDGEARQIIVKEIATGAAYGMMVGDAKIRDLDWAGPEDLLITTSATSVISDVLAPRGEWMMLFAYNLKTKKSLRLLRDVSNGLNVLAGKPSVRIVNGKPLVFAEGWKFDEGGRGRIALYRIELERGTSRVIHPGFLNTRDWLVGKDGEALAESEYEVGSGRWTIKVKRGDDWQELKSGTALHEPPRLLGLGRTPTSILVADSAESVEADEAGALIREVGMDGVWSEAIMPNGAAAIRDPVGHHLIGHTRLVGDDFHYNFFNPEDQRAWRAVAAAYPDDPVTLVSWSGDRKRLIVLVDSPTHGPAYSFVDLTTKKASWIGAQYQGIGPGDVAPVRPVRFKAADGLDLSGYLITPLGRPAKNLPLVVLPHGGPADRDQGGFDWAAQAFASRGYAVLKVNFRGSGGFGQAFTEAGHGEWGRKMQTDLSDGVRHLAAEGVIDPKRVCIVGDDYGGYAAISGVTFEQGVYRCAASYGGMTDLTRFAPWVSGRHGPAMRRRLIRLVGAEDSKDPVMAQISPAKHVDRIEAPILLIHGRDDTVVPFEQSKLMADALKKAGKPVELVALQGEDHWLSRGETRLQMLTAMVAFLEKHNPPN